jgi:methionyl-tRNA formyltransferase
MKEIRVVFMGSPAFSVPILAALNEHTTVLGVVTQPDRPKGRGRKMVAPPVKELAQEYGLPVIQPRRIRKDEEVKQQLKQWNADLFVVAALGKFFRRTFLIFLSLGVSTFILLCFLGGGALLQSKKRSSMEMLKPV